MPNPSQHYAESLRFNSVGHQVENTIISTIFHPNGAMKKYDDTQLDAFLEAFRRTSPESHLPSAVLTDSQWAIFNQLRGFLGNDYGLFAGASLSAFFDPTHKRLREFKEEAFCGSVLFAVTSRKIQGVPLFFVIDVNDALKGLCVDEMLKGIEAEFQFWKEPLDVVEYARNVYIRVQQVEAKAREFHKFPVHGVEWNVGKRLILDNLVDRDLLILERRQKVDNGLVDGVQRRANRMLREVSLTRIAPKIWDEIPIQLKHVFETSPVDILLHSICPNTPILGIEIDGQHHLEPQQKKKDRIKDAIFAELGLPLLRVLPTDVNNFKMPKGMLDSNARRYAELFTNMARCLALGFKEFHKDYVEEISFEFALEEEQEILSKALFGKANATLSQEQQKIVSDNLVDTQSFEDYQNHIRLSQFWKETQGQPRLDRDWSKLSKYCTEPVLIQTTEGRWMISATFKYDGVTQRLPSPEVHCVVNHLEIGELQEIIFECLFIFAKSWVEDEVIRNSR